MTDNPFRTPDTSDLSSDVPIDYLRECLRYEPDTGLLFWRARPIRHFTAQRYWKAWNTTHSGAEALRCLNAGGYKHGAVRYAGRVYWILAHRAMWALQTGAWPVLVIDHKNRCKIDNKFVNLREVSESLNAFNRPIYANKSGFTGVRLHRGWYESRVGRNCRHLYLGRFTTPEEAHAVYRAKAFELHGENK